MAKRLFLISLFIVAAGALTSFVVHDDNSSALVSKRDVDFFWRVASGPDGQRNDRAEPLYAAVIRGNRSEVARLLAAGASPNLLLSDDSWSVLMIAAAKNDLPTMKILKCHGANLN